MQPHGDAASVKLPKGLIKRVYLFAKPYRARLILLDDHHCGDVRAGRPAAAVIKLIIDDALPNRTSAC